MSEGKRGPGEGRRWNSIPAKVLRLARGNTSVNTSLSTRQPSGVEDGRSGTGPLQPQAAAGRAQEVDNAVAQQGSGRGVEPRTLDLISSIDRHGTSSADHDDPRTMDLISAIDRRGTSSANAEGSDGDGEGRRPPQGDEARASARPAPDAMGHGNFIGNVAGTMAAPIPSGEGLGPPQLPQGDDAHARARPMPNATGHGNFTGDAAGTMAAPIPGGKGRGPPPLQQGDEAHARARPASNAIGHGNFTGNAAKTMAAPIPGGGTPPPRPMLTPAEEQMIVSAAERYLSQSRNRQRMAAFGMQPQQHFATHYPGPSVNVPRLPGGKPGAWMGEQRGASSRGSTLRHGGASSYNLHGPARATAPATAGQPVAATAGGSGDRRPQRQASVRLEVQCPVEQPAVSEALGSHPPQPQPQPQIQLQPQPQPQPQAGLCRYCYRRQGIFVPAPPPLPGLPSSPGHVCLCSVCKNNPEARCLTCIVNGWVRSYDESARRRLS